MSDFDPYHKWLGISETARPVSKYRLLGIDEFESDRDVISAAAERQTVYLRTLQAGEHAVLVAELLNEVSQARVTLLNVSQKAEYDEELRKQQTPELESEPAPEEDPMAFAAEQLAADSSRPATRSRSLVGKPFWKEPWAAAAGGIVVVLLLLVMLWPEGSGTKKPGKTTNDPVQEQTDSPSVQLATREKVSPLQTAWLGEEALKILLELDCTKKELVRQHLHVPSEWKQTEKGLEINGHEVRALMTKEKFAMSNIAVDLSVAIRVPAGINNHCWGIGLGSSRIGFFAEPGKRWLFYGRWNADDLTQPETHSPYKQNYVNEGMATFDHQKSDVRLLLSSGHEFSRLFVWVDKKLLCDFNERKIVVGNAPVIVHVSHASLIVKRLRISTFE
jgi:hypothetical protein